MYVNECILTIDNGFLLINVARIGMPSSRKRNMYILFVGGGEIKKEDSGEPSFFFTCYIVNSFCVS
jgi:hypothetical protein